MYTSQSIRAFIGAKNFEQSREFYRDLGFTEIVISHNMSLVKVNDNLAFYLQDYYVEEWIHNSMIFLEVDDVEACETDLHSRDLLTTYPTVKISKIKTWDWGREIFMHDPAGVLWHFGKFN